MPIGRSLKKQRLQEEIKNIMASNAILDYKREACGNLLFSYAKQYSYCDANKIMGDFNLKETLNLNYHCPAVAPFIKK